MTCEGSRADESGVCANGEPKVGAAVCRRREAGATCTGPDCALSRYLCGDCELEAEGAPGVLDCVLDDRAGSGRLRSLRLLSFSSEGDRIDFRSIVVGVQLLTPLSLVPSLAPII